MPGIQFHAVVADKDADELMATEVNELMLGTDAKQSTPELAVMKTREVRIITSNEYELMDYKDVVAELKKTPKAMRMKAVRVAARNGTDSVAYLVPDPKKRRLRIETVEGARCEDHVLAAGSRAFSSQGRRLLDHIASRMLANANLTNLERLPSKIVLQRRVGCAPASNKGGLARTRHWDNPRDKDVGDCASVGSDDAGADDWEAEGEEEEQSDGANEDIDEGESDAQEDVASDCSQEVMDIKTPTKPSHCGHARSPATLRLVGPALQTKPTGPRSAQSPKGPTSSGDMDSKGEPPRGTAAYWMFKTPLEKVLLGMPSGHQESQAKLLMPKLSEPDRQRLRAHMESVQLAKQLVDGQAQLLQLPELVDKARTLSRALDTWPPDAQGCLMKCHLNRHLGELHQWQGRCRRDRQDHRRDTRLLRRRSRKVRRGRTHIDQR